MSELKPCPFCGEKANLDVTEEFRGDFDEPCGSGEVPPPGSADALGQGCTCPVYDNAHGAGMGRDEHGQVVYVMDWDCPLHGAPYKRNCGTEIAATATD